MKKTLVFIFIMILCMTLYAPVFALTIKLGSLAPTGSPWDKILNELTAEWKKISGGSVVVKIYPGGVAGDESTMLRKIRLRQLHAAAITGVGLNQISVGPLALSAPLLIRNDREFDFILEKVTPYFNKELEKKQFVPILWTFAGWTYFYTRKPVISPDDMKKQKLWVWDVSPTQIQLWKNAGFSPVPLAAPDVLMSLQSGMLDAICATPLTAAAYQWFAISKNMCNMRFAPMIAGMIISKTTWEDIPADLRPKLIESAKKVSRKIVEETRKADAEAIEVMKQYGLVVNAVPEKSVNEWELLISRNIDILVKEEFGTEAYNLIKSQLEEFRKNAGK